MISYCYKHAFKKDLCLFEKFPLIPDLFAIEPFYQNELLSNTVKKMIVEKDDSKIASVVTEMDLMSLVHSPDYIYYKKRVHKMSDIFIEDIILTYQQANI